MNGGADALVVSIHDVSPLTREGVGRMLADLAGVGVGRVSLLVIPDHHGRADIARDPGFARWLTEREAEGHEIVAHGYFHRREQRSGEGPLDAFFTRFYTAGEGEFYDLSRVDALALLERVKERFGRLGFHPRGFIAPAWLLGREADAAVAEAGFDYTVRLRTVHDLGRGVVWRSQSLVYSVRSRWRRAMSRVWNPLLAGMVAGLPLMRIGVHPPDLTHPAVWGQVLELAGRAAAARRAITYGDWIVEGRGSGG